MQKFSDTVSLSTVEGVGLIEIDSPPVNALSQNVKQGLMEALDQASLAGSIRSIVIACAGRTFSVGADISELGKPLLPTLPDLIAKIECVKKPVVMAIHGNALGGGLEMAMAGHFRIATPTASLGLPEVKLGILPGAGGTQRLPRLIGVRRALEIITSGRSVSAQEAYSIGLVDKLSDADNLREIAINFAREQAETGSLPIPLRDNAVKLNDAHYDPMMFDKFREQNERKFRGFHAPEKIIESLEAAVSKSFDAGLAFERSLLNQLLEGPQSKALRYIFAAERLARKVEGLPKDTQINNIAKVGVIGAGTMGGGIAMNFLNIGIPVTIIDASDDGLKRGLATIERNYENSLARKKITREQIEDRMGLLEGSTDLADVATCDLIIEAVYENIDVKKSIFSQLDKIAKGDAVLATNTSYLDVDEIAAATSRPEKVIGLHFFSPANIMRLLEIVRASKTDANSLATSADLAKRIDKVGVVVGNGWGFVGNRILNARRSEAQKLILEGAAPWDVDRLLYDFGFPMGPFQLLDLVGLDVGWNKDDTASRSVREILNEMGRHGQKTKGGFYDYDDKRNRTPSIIAEKVIIDFAKTKGIERRTITDSEILDRTLYAMVNEGAKILEEGIATRASDIDIIWVTGYGWPKYKGGPMYWADQVGLNKIEKRLRDLSEKFGNHFKPANLLTELAASGGKFND